MAEAHIYIYGAIGQGGVTSEKVKSQIDAAKNASKIILHVSSQGGEVYEGYTIYNLLKNSGKPIETLIEGFCASIATLVALAGDTVIMNDTSSFMIHNPFVGIEGDADALRKAADHLDAIKNELIKVYSKKTGLSSDELWTMMNNETYFKPSQAKEIGFATETTEAYKAVAFFDTSKLKTQEMATENKTLFEGLRKEFSEVKNMIAKLVSKPKNMEMKLADGTMIYVESEDGDIVGKPVFVMGTDGNSPAPDGEHDLEDGRKIVVKGGIVESVVEAALATDETELEALKAENEALKNELAAIKNTNTELVNKVETTESALVELNEKVENLLSKLPAGTAKPVVKAAFKAVDKKNTDVEVPALAGWGLNIIAEKQA